MERAVLDGPAIRRAALPLSIEAYHTPGGLGKIPEKTELLFGVVVEKRPKDPLHSALVARLHNLLSRALSDRYMLRQENPLTLDTSEPEPDLAVVDFRDDFYSQAHPRTAHLVIEVSNTTLDLDREKAEIYAMSNIPEYWIVNLKNGQVELFREPTPAGYQVHRRVPADELISPLVLPELEIKLSSLII